MSEHPIIFSGEMVKAILAGRKTQTRRVVKPQPKGLDPSLAPTGAFMDESGTRPPLWFINGKWRKCPYGQPGDLLWVRETHHIDQYPDGALDAHGNPGTVHYRADTDVISQSWEGQWRPSIFMPRWASRITLEVVSVRVEQVQSISEDDAKDEGVEPIMHDTGGFEPWDAPCPEVPNYAEGFAALWDSINAKRGYSWQSNPWVWVVEFRQT